MQLGNNLHVAGVAGRADLQLDAGELTHLLDTRSLVWGWFGWIAGEKLVTAFESSRLAPIGEEAEMADANEGAGKHVEEEPPHEFQCGEGHDPGAISVLAVSITEGNLTVSQRDDTVVGDGDTVRVASQVVQGSVGAVKRWPTIDHPVLLPELIEALTEVLGWVRENELGSGVAHGMEELPSEQPGECANGKEKAGPGREPLTPVERESAGGDQAMEMDVVAELLIPGVQDRGESQLSAQAVLRIGGKLLKRPGDRLKEETVDEPWIVPRERVDLVRQCEDGVEVGHGQQLRPPLLEPLSLGQDLTLGTVAVAAGVVSGALEVAAITPFQVPAQAGRPTDLDRVQDAKFRT